VHISQLLHRSLSQKSDVWHRKVQFYTFVTVPIAISASIAVQCVFGVDG